MPDRTVIYVDSNLLAGTPVFAGTRVPIKNLLDSLRAGDTVDDFLEAFPTVSRDQVLKALELAEEALTASVGPHR